MRISKYLFIAAAPLLLAGCLDTSPQGDSITAMEKSDNYKSNPARISAGVSGIMSAFSLYESVRAVHSDFGYPAIMLQLDNRGVDMVSDKIGYNWFSNSLTYDNIDYTYGDDRAIWGNFYNQIYACNQILASIDPTSMNATTKNYVGQALAVRAFDYFNLVQIYQKTYAQVTPNTALGVPLITEENREIAKSEGLARATVKETYDQILSDLDKAISYLDDSRDDKRYVNVYVARAIRAKVYLVMQNYAAALDDANFVISNSGATPYSISDVSKPSFISIDDNSWLWGIKVSETDDIVVSGIVNFPSHMGTFNYGYASVGAWRRINKKLYNEIPSTDVRKGWFLDANKLSSALTVAQQSYVNDYGCPAYTQVKFAPYKNVLGTSTNASDFPLIRIEEMYLIKAEAEAMSGNPSQGAADLQSFVRTYRDPSYTITATSAADVQEAVFQQRRIEFWGEGITWFDYIRLNKNFDRRGGGFETEYVYNIPAGDNALIWRIPQNEAQYNKKIGSDYNNPVATHPQPVPDI